MLFSSFWWSWYLPFINRLYMLTIYFLDRKKLSISNCWIHVNMSVDVHFIWWINGHSQKLTTLHIGNDVLRWLWLMQCPCLTWIVKFSKTWPSLFIFILIHIVSQYCYIRTLNHNFYNEVALETLYYEVFRLSKFCPFLLFGPYEHW